MVKQYYYILAEHMNLGYVISKFIDEEEAIRNFTRVNSKLVEGYKSEKRALDKIHYLKRYFIKDETKILNINGMIFSKGIEVNTYLIYSNSIINDFNDLPRVYECELFHGESDECDFPF